MSFSIPGVFAKWKSDTLAKEEFNQNEFLKMIIEDYNKGKYASTEDIVNDFKSIIE